MEHFLGKASFKSKSLTLSRTIWFVSDAQTIIAGSKSIPITDFYWSLILLNHIVGSDKGQIAK